MKTQSKLTKVLRNFSIIELKQLFQPDHVAELADWIELGNLIIMTLSALAMMKMWRYIFNF